MSLLLPSLITFCGAVSGLETEKTAVGPIKPCTGRSLKAPSTGDTVSTVNSLDTGATVASADASNHFRGGLYTPYWGYGTGLITPVPHHHHHIYYGGFRKLLTADKADTATTTTHVQADNSATTTTGAAATNTADATANINSAQQWGGFGSGFGSGIGSLGGGGGWDSNLPSGFGNGRFGRWGWRRLLSSQ